VKIFVEGDPAPKGSVSLRYGRVAHSAASKSWEERVVAAALAAKEGDTIEGPVRIGIDFRLRAPRRKVRELPVVRPDLDKLVRCVFDGLTKAGIYRDDAQVVAVNALKRYADPGKEGCLITIIG